LRSGGYGIANKISSFLSMFYVVGDELCVMFDELGVDFDSKN
jgi:hypothetical protein